MSSTAPPDRELRRLYLEQGHSERSLAERFDTSRATVRRWLVRAGITPRSRREQRRIDRHRPHADPVPDVDTLRAHLESSPDPEQAIEQLAARHAVDRQWIEHLIAPPATDDDTDETTARRTRLPIPEGLERRYCEALESIGQLARDHGVSTATVRSWLGRLEIPLRSRGEQQQIDRERRRPPRDALVELYVEQRQSLAAVAQHLEVNRATLGRWLDELDIPRRPRLESSRIVQQRNRMPVPEDLEHRYVELQHPASSLAEHYGVSPPTVFAWLEEANLETRSVAQQRRLQAGTPQAPTPAELRRLYLDEGLSMNRIAQRFETSRNTVRRWLDDAGIARRSRRQALRRPRTTPPPPDETLRHLYDEALESLATIAARFDVSPGTVRNWLLAAGIDLSPAAQARRREARRQVPD